MLEKLTCCLAHPMTALRTLKDKINDVITAHNELVNKVDNLPSGGGGGSSGSGVCTVTVKTLANTELTDFTFISKDKSFTELKETYDSGGLVWCRLVIPDEDDPVAANTAVMECLLVAFMEMGEEAGFMFRPTQMDNPMVVILNNDMVMIQND